jgi:phosphoserine aminotransferase
MENFTNTIQKQGGLKKMYGRIFNFSAGPAVLPESVLEQARDELLNYRGSGMSVMEMSHRSKEYESIIEGAQEDLRRLMDIPEDYAVLFLQGGASLQFAMVPINLYLPGKPVDVLHTGIWTKKAIEELKKLTEYRIAGSSEKENFKRIPHRSEIQFSDRASYVYMASNNTIYGSQWKTFPETGDIPLVADMSSDILSRAIDVRRFGLIFAGAQKNIGPSGVTVVVIRKDLAERCKLEVPTMLQYRAHIKEGSMYNTPPAYAIYIAGLVLDWIELQGGVAVIEKRNEEKSRLLYDAIDASNLFYGPIEKDSRSRMNVVFRVKGDKEDLEEKFASEAKKNGLSGLKGHRSAGGLRASIYNALPLEGVKALVEFMKEFEKKYS